MKPSECLAKDTNGEESKKKLEKEKVKGKRTVTILNFNNVS